MEKIVIDILPLWAHAHLLVHTCMHVHTHTYTYTLRNTIGINEWENCASRLTLPVLWSPTIDE